jgi:hypothetical protein
MKFRAKIDKMCDQFPWSLIITTATMVAFVLVIGHIIDQNKILATQRVEAHAITRDMSRSCENQTGGRLDFSQVLLACETVAARGLVHKDDAVAVTIEQDKKGNFVAGIYIIREHKTLPLTNAHNKSPIKALAEALAKAY